MLTSKYEDEMQQKAQLPGDTLFQLLLYFAMRSLFSDITYEQTVIAQSV
jgi:hypothetical protein